MACPGIEWRRVLKSMHAVEYLIKNGSPMSVQQIKRENYKLSSLTNFSYSEGGIDKGKPVREKCNLLCDLLANEDLLMRERKEAFDYRQKCYPGSGPSASEVGVGSSSLFNTHSGSNLGYGGGGSSHAGLG